MITATINLTTVYLLIFLIIWIKSEVKTILNISNGGEYVCSNNPKEVYEKIISLKNNIEKSIEIGSNARDYVKNNFSSENVLNSFLNKVNQIINEK